MVHLIVHVTEPWATTFWMIVVFAVLHGLAWGMRGPPMGALRADYFGSAAFGTIGGFSPVVVMFGMMGGPVTAGALADRSGSYRLGFTLLAAFVALGSVFFALARRPTPPSRDGERQRARPRRTGTQGDTPLTGTILAETRPTCTWAPLDVPGMTPRKARKGTR